MFRGDIINGTTLGSSLLSDFKLNNTLESYLPQGQKFTYNASFGHNESLQEFNGKPILVL